MRARVVAGVIVVGVIAAAGCSSTPQNLSSSTTPPTATSGTLAPGEKPSSSKRGSSERPYAEQLTASIADIQDWWATTFPKVYRGKAYERIPDSKITAANPQNPAKPCTTRNVEPDYKDIEGNAFYCPLGRYVAYDDYKLFPQIYADFGAFAPTVALAHEWGHAVQDQAGIIDDYKTILIEQQADCFAGAWTRHSLNDDDAGVRIQPGDLETAIAALILVKDPLGTDIRDPRAHGSGFDRINAFSEGFEQGPERCVDYENDPPNILDIKFSSREEAASGGNNPYTCPAGAQDCTPTVDLITQDLQAYWTSITQAYGLEPFKQVDNVIRFGPDTDMPRCGSRQYTREEALNHIFFCVDDNYVAWDEAWLSTDVNGIGDFAVGLLLGQQWAKSFQQQEGQTKDMIESKQGELQQACFTGAWAGAVLGRDRNGDGEITKGEYDTHNDGILSLSPGDLDEGMIAYLAFSESPDETGSTRRGTAFEKAAAFRDGFFNDVAKCDTYSSGGGPGSSGTSRSSS